MAAFCQCACMKRCVRCLKQRWKDDAFLRQMIYLHAVTFLIILPLTCNKLPNSLYHIRPADTKVQQDLERAVNDKRIHQADQYMAMINSTKLHGMLQAMSGGLHSHHPSERLDLAIAIVTISRNTHRLDKYEPRYLTQVAATLLRLLNEAHSRGFLFSVKVAVCNVDRVPQLYKEAKSLKDVLPSYERFDEKTKPPLTLTHTLEKEKQDYVFCMESALNESNARYVMIIEDDALPHDDMFTVIEHTLAEHPVDVDGEHTHQPPLYFKFYHPERLLTFISLEVERLPELFALGATFGSILAFFYYISLNVRSQKTVHIYQIWGCFTVYVILLFLSVGRTNLLEIRRLFPPHFYEYSPAPSCCTPALLFTNHGARTIASHLKSVTCKNHYGKDTAMADYMYDNNAKAYLIQPNLVSHIGMYSSLRNVILDPYILP